MGSEETTRLFLQARDGAEDARDALYERCARKLLPLIRVRMGRALRAEMESRDVLQNVLLKTLRKLPDLAEPRAIMAWLAKVAENELRDLADYRGRQRRDAARRVPLEDEATEVPARARQALSLAIASEAADQLEGALATLPDAHREVVVLRKLEELTFPEIAVRLGRSEDACRMLFARAMTSLTLALRAPAGARHGAAAPGREPPAHPRAS
jgi:RNA polymerase sigma-70 factor (ECF subfamily)